MRMNVLRAGRDSRGGLVYLASLAKLQPVGQQHLHRRLVDSSREIVPAHMSRHLKSAI